jgi:hypothetical protein
MATVGVSTGLGSGPDGPRSRLGCFFIFKNPFFVSVGNDRYYKPFIFCIIQIVSVAGTDTKYRFPTDTTNTFCSSVKPISMSGFWFDDGCIVLTEILKLFEPKPVSQSV